jgi:hypothetical protein
VKVAGVLALFSLSFFLKKNCRELLVLTLPLPLSRTSWSRRRWAPHVGHGAAVNDDQGGRLGPVAAGKPAPACRDPAAASPEPRRCPRSPPSEDPCRLGETLGLPSSCASRWRRQISTVRSSLIQQPRRLIPLRLKWGTDRWAPRIRPFFSFLLRPGCAVGPA